MKSLTFKILTLLGPILGLIFGCARVQTLNLKSHGYSDRPKNIIWFQIAGLQEEHLAMLRFTAPQGAASSSFENISCAGKAWTYNLYGLRPTARDGFLSQLVGTKNIKGTCEDFKQRPLWGYVSNTGYKVGIFEAQAGDASLSTSVSCEGSEGFLGNATLWKMEKGSSENQFHYLGNENFEKGKIYFDKSCQTGNCFATFQDNLKSIWRRFKKELGQTIFIVRDFSYLGALRRGDIARAREILTELEQSLRYFYEEFERGNETLFLVTSAAPLNFEMPKKGKEWFEFETEGKHVVFRNTSLLSPVLARGTGAENFCGVYEEFEIIKRIFWTTTKKIWNPLNLF